MLKNIQALGVVMLHKMKTYKFLLTILLTLCTITTITANDDSKKKIFRGYEGGMMLHGGYLSGNITPLAYQAEGLTKGIGGAIRLRFGDHWRLGTEGYTSTIKLKQLEKGSYIKTFWAGLLTDYTWTWGRFAPYLGITIGGGSTTDFIMKEGNGKDWTAEAEAYYHKAPFVAIVPFIGCDYILSDKLHLTLKVDYLNGISNRELYLPKGPRVYFGFMFCH